MPRAVGGRGDISRNLEIAWNRRTDLEHPETMTTSVACTWGCRRADDLLQHDVWPERLFPTDARAREYPVAGIVIFGAPFPELRWRR